MAMRIYLNFSAFRRSALYRASYPMKTAPFAKGQKSAFFIGYSFPPTKRCFAGDPENTPTRTDRRNLHSFLRVSQRVKDKNGVL